MGFSLALSRPWRPNRLLSIDTSQHNAGMGLRCLVVDDDDFTRVTLEAALQSQGFDVVAAVGSAEDAVRIVRSHQVDVATLDLDLGPGPTGIDVAFGLRRLRPTVGIVILTSFSDPRLLASSTQQLPPGATYVVKQSLTDIAFLREAIQGSVMTHEGTQLAKSSAANVPLSDPQIETLRLLAYGLSNDQIAEARFVSRKSVEQAIRRIADSLEVSKDSGSNLRVALAREYFRLTGATRHVRV